MKIIIIASLATMLSGCPVENPRYHKADHRILYDITGCAYMVQPDVGDAAFVGRLPDADKPTCKDEAK